MFICLKCTALNWILNARISEWSQTFGCHCKCILHFHTAPQNDSSLTIYSCCREERKLNEEVELGHLSDFGLITDEHHGLAKANCAELHDIRACSALFSQNKNISQKPKQ